MSQHIYSPRSDTTDVQRFAQAGLPMSRTCGIGPGEHRTIQTAGGQIRRGIWRCAACVQARGSKG